ncbi:hypothetical protein EDD21DRAFT_430441 [Dissophora ornata]|nr:hypothetical protein EDD21DRAFT_430441 [Dissophora ornata]
MKTTFSHPPASSGMAMYPFFNMNSESFSSSSSARPPVAQSSPSFNLGVLDDDLLSTNSFSDISCPWDIRTMATSIATSASVRRMVNDVPTTHSECQATLDMSPVPAAKWSEVYMATLEWIIGDLLPFSTLDSELVQAMVRSYISMLSQPIVGAAARTDATIGLPSTGWKETSGYMDFRTSIVKAVDIAEFNMSAVLSTASTTP